MNTGPHEMAITFDPKTQGSVSLFLDGQSFDNGTLPLVASPKVGQEIWINAEEWDLVDTSFRGTLHRFTMYAEALPPQEIAAPTASSLQGS